MAYSLAAIFGGAVPPLVAAAVIAAYGSFVFSVLLALLCLVSVICTYVLKADATARPGGHHAADGHPRGVNERPTGEKAYAAAA